MIAADHLSSLLGEDPFALAVAIEQAAKVAGRARADAAHAERIRKVKVAELQRAFRDSTATTNGALGKRPTVAETEDAALTSPAYREHLDWQRALEIAAADAEAAYYGLRNRADWLAKAADGLRAEAYLAGR